MFSLTKFHNCGQDSNGPRDLSGGPAAFERATHAAQKPCRMNNQFATSPAARQQSAHEERGWFSARLKPYPEGIQFMRRLLIVPQRDDGIDAQGAPSGDGTSQKSNNQEQRGHGKKDKRRGASESSMTSRMERTLNSGKPGSTDCTSRRICGSRTDAGREVRRTMLMTRLCR